MDVLLHSLLKEGRIRRFRNVPCDVADRMFDTHKQLLTIPFDPRITYYRVTLEDPLRGNYVVRDSDWELHGMGGTPAGELARGTQHRQLVTGA